MSLMILITLRSIILLITLESSLRYICTISTLTSGMSESTLNLFFGEDKIPAILSDRINNEYSHLCGVFERAATPVEVPEMKTAACQIIEKLKEDEGQYSALLKSVGEYIEQ